MNSGAPYRPPCTGWGRTRYSGGCFQHWRSSEAHTAKFQNVTAVANWLCADDAPGSTTPPSTILPYERIQPGAGGDANCGNYYVPIPGMAGYCAGGHEAHTKKPCGAWNEGEFPGSCSGADVRLDLNCYHALPGVTQDLGLCQKAGFKGAQARVVWYRSEEHTSELQSLRHLVC